MANVTVVWTPTSAETALFWVVFDFCVVLYHFCGPGIAVGPLAEQTVKGFGLFFTLCAKLDRF